MRKSTLRGHRTEAQCNLAHPIGPPRLLPTTIYSYIVLTLFTCARVEACWHDTWKKSKSALHFQKRECTVGYEHTVVVGGYDLRGE